MIESKIDNNGVEIQIYENSNYSCDAILFLHPQGSSSKIWRNISNFFDKDFHVILMDLRGHGESERAKGGYDIHTQCKDILSVFEKTKIEKAHFVGNSLGGDIATAFASIFPEKVLSLTNIDSGMIDYIGREGERNISKEEVIEEFKNREITCFQSRTEMVESVQSKIPVEIWKDYFEEWFKFVSIYKLENCNIFFSYQIPTNINVQIMEMVCDLYFKDLYRSIICPILFLPAEREDHLSVKLKNINEANKYTFTKTSIIPNSKHLMILDMEDEVCEEISNFFREIQRNNEVSSNLIK